LLIKINPSSFEIARKRDPCASFLLKTFEIPYSQSIESKVKGIPNANLVQIMIQFHIICVPKIKIISDYENNEELFESLVTEKHKFKVKNTLHH